MMHALSLWQPWASAIAQGDKKVETRGRPIMAKVDFLAIHAAKIWGPTQREAAERIRLLIGSQARSPCAGIEGTVYHADYFTGPNPGNQRGAVVAVARFIRCEQMTDALIAKQTAVERVLGDWRPGRYAWFLREDVVALEDPLPLRDHQWLWKLPEDVEAELRKRAGLPALEAA